MTSKNTQDTMFDAILEEINNTDVEDRLQFTINKLLEEMTRRIEVEDKLHDYVCVKSEEKLLDKYELIFGLLNEKVEIMKDKLRASEYKYSKLVQLIEKLLGNVKEVEEQISIDKKN